MLDKKSMERGWAFATQIVGGSIAATNSISYANRVAQVQIEIEKLTGNLLALKSNAPDASIGGFAAEAWHEGTFNIGAKTVGSTNVAVTGRPGTEGALGRNNNGSVDIRIQTSNGVPINDYSSKYMVNAKETAKEQARPHRNGTGTKFDRDYRLNPSDQINDVKDISENRANNPETPENWKQGYKETAELSTDKIADGKAESKPLSKQESLDLAKEIKQGKIDLKKHGVENELTAATEVIKQAAKAGLTAAIISAIMQTAPEIFKAINYLIKNKELDPEQLKRIGTKAITAGPEGFVLGSLACTLQIKIAEGALGPSLQTLIFDSMGPTILGTIVALTYVTIKNSVLVAVGKMTAREMGAALMDTVIISSGYVAGASIGGVIGQAIGFTIPVIGYLLGSLVGCAFAVAYNIGKKRFISFCVDSGFTCFGLVDQDYSLPEEVLEDMGIDVTPITRTKVLKTEIARISFQNYLKNNFLETIEIKIVKRGIIGVNRVGYVI